MAKHSHGTPVRYCHEGEDRYAQVTDVHPTTGDVLGLAVYTEEHDAAGNVVARSISHGVANPMPATTPQHRIESGHFWR